ncbi:MAG TPA: cellulose synthase subunit BcsC-related outer membrane protein [Acidobacteriaceae bacterium]|nr:cellulose synthase subunit BcsC-related outer membrane protein [Acidobacteriaceae bacterium]
MGAIAAGCPGTLHAASSAEQALLARAQSLASHGHVDMAVQIWQQVLLSDPQSREALAGVARAEMQLGKPQDAEKYLSRLRTLGGSAAEIAQIEAMPHVQPPAVRLDEARRLARSGQYDQALRIYHDVYGGQPPAGDAALEYYDTEAAIPAGRQDAVAGLRRLAQQFPADSRYAVTLGRILTYDPRTRAEGIGILERYPSASAAQEALKQAEAWNEIAPAGRSANSAPAGNPVEAAAYRDLNSGHFEEARRLFEEILARDPNHAGALSGMGYVAMKEKDFSAAENYLERARTAGATGLESAIALSQFYQKMASGDAELTRNNSGAAIEAYRAALQLKPSSPEALEALGGALLQQGSVAEAEDLFQRALRAMPDRAGSWRGLFMAQSAAGDAQDAVATSDRMPAGIRAQMNTEPDYLRALAEDDLALGRKAESDNVVRKALALPFPNQGRDLPPDRQMQYAALLMTAKRYDPALQLYRQVIAADPGNMGAWRALIAAQHQMGNDEAALATIGGMPQSAFDQIENDAGFLALVGSIYQSQRDWARAEKYLERALAKSSTPGTATELQLADVYAAEGKVQAAYAIYRRETQTHAENLAGWRGLLNTLHQSGQDREALQELSTMQESTRLRLAADPGYLQTLASIEGATGENAEALRTFDQLSGVYAAQSMPMPADVQIQYGWALLQAGADSRLYALVSSVDAASDLSDAQQANLNKLLAAWSVRRAAIAAGAGDQRRSIAILETAARAIPANTDILNALAGAYLKAGEAKRAVLVYASLDMGAATRPQMQGAIGAALAAGDTKHAVSWLESALDRFPNDAAILKMAAEYEQATGNSARAEAYYRAALAAMGPASAMELLPPRGGATGVPGADSPTRDLMDLLAPRGSGAGDGSSGAPGTQSGSANLSWQEAPVRSVPTLGDFAQSSSQERPGAWPVAGDSGAGHASAVADRPEPAGTAGGLDAENCCDDLRPPATVPPLQLPKMLPREAQASQDARPVDADVSAPDATAVPAPQSDRRLTVPRSTARLETTGADDDAAIDLESAARTLVTLDATYRQPLRSIPAPDDPAPAPLAMVQSAPQQLGPLTPPVRGGLRSEPLPGIEVDEGIALDTSQDPAGQKETGPQALPPLTGPATAVQHAKTPREEINEQLAILKGASSGWLGGSSGVDYRSGQPGYDRLAAYDSEAEASGPLGSAARLTVIAEPVLLDSGAATGAATIRQGTLPATAIPAQESASGLGGELQLRTRDFAASVGTTPRGFLVANIIGGLYLHPPARHFTVTLSRAPVVDTQLSYAGLRDQGSQGPTYAGNVWGGVIASGGELQVASGDGHSGWYLQGGGQYLDGIHVPSNKRFDGDVGAYWGVWHSADSANVTVGMNFFGMHYTQNLRYFTYGQAGYFSPDAYVVAGVPVSVNGHYEQKFHYKLTASLGLQAFNEEASPYFPIDPAVQTAEGNLYYPAQTSVGGNYDFEGEGAYAIADHWYAGGYLSFNNSRDYASSSAGFYLRYLFRPQPQGDDTSPTGLFPARGYRPLQVP